ncbi:unnamed protein product [Ambrosiozyma monospora]|uniref:Unnamed protein product n=1 Tax=Ambrosiozyma monospora TaxID=43982 RepID=A0A9W7DHK6_AMBMO|nr:unnamed protein product [Ambrosiozyma monospora]
MSLPKKTSPLLSKLDNNIENILTKVQDILNLSTINEKSLELQTIETLQIESNIWTIIRLVDELLGLTRTLKENWILGYVPVYVSNGANVSNVANGNGNGIGNAIGSDSAVGNGNGSGSGSGSGSGNEVVQEEVDEEQDRKNVELQFKINRLIQDITGLVDSNE